MFCEYCGAPLTGPFCAQCGKKVVTQTPIENQVPTFEPKTAQAEPSQKQMPRFYFPVKNGANDTTPLGAVQEQPADRAVNTADAVAEQGSEPAPAAHTKPSTAYSPFALAENPAQYAQAPIEFGRDYKPEQASPAVAATDEAQHTAAPQSPNKSAALPEDGVDVVGSFDEDAEPVGGAKAAQEKKSEENEKNEEKAKKRPKREKKSAPIKVPLKGGKLFPAVFAFFLPIVYLFLDLFVVYPANMLQKAADGVSALDQLIDWATSVAYDGYSAKELFSNALGEGASISYLSFRGLLAGVGEALPVLVILATVALSAILGVLIIVTKGKFLKKRIFSDLTVATGLAAAAAPLLAYTLKTVVTFFSCFDLEKTEETMALFGVGIEALLAMLLCALFLIPAIRTLGTYGARARGEILAVSTPCALLGRSFLSAKVFALIALLGGVAIGASLTVKMELAVRDGASFMTLMNMFGESLRMLFSKDGSVNLWMRFFSLFEELLHFLMIVMMCLMMVVPISYVFGLLFMKQQAKKPIQRQERNGKIGEATGRSVRNLLLLPFVAYIAFYVITTALLLFTSRVAIRFDLSDTKTTLDLVYYVIAYVRSLGGMGAGYILALSAAFPLWHLTRGFRNIMAAQRVAREESDEMDEMID